VRWDFDAHASPLSLRPLFDPHSREVQIFNKSEDLRLALYSPSATAWAEDQIVRVTVTSSSVLAFGGQVIVKIISGDNCSMLSGAPPMVIPKIDVLREFLGAAR
jgi:hypothetical protein